MAPKLSLQDTALVAAAGGVETCLPTSTRGNAAAGSDFWHSCKTNYFTRYTSSIDGGLSIGLKFNRVGMKFQNVESGALNSITYQCMYNGSTDARIGSGQQDPFNITAGTIHKSVTDEFCTVDARIWHAFVNTSTSCSDCCAPKCGAAGIDTRGQYINTGDENQLRATANGGGSDPTTHGVSAQFDHTDA